MYSNHKLCEALKPKELCIVVEQYKEGLFERAFHEHVPAHRLSEESLHCLLQALVIRFGELSADTVLRCYLNDRGTNPPKRKLMWHVEYPEAGVIRQYCGTNTIAWADKVLSVDCFRQQV